MAIGAALLLGLAAARGLWAHRSALVAVAVCDVAAPFSLLTLAQEHVFSWLAGVLVASTPLFAAAMLVLALVALGYATATWLVRRLDDLAPLAISAAALAIATVRFAPAAALSFPRTPTPPPGRRWPRSASYARQRPSRSTTC